MFEQLKQIISEQLTVDLEKVPLDARITEDLGADSLDLFELVMAIEEAFSVEIPSEDLEQIATVEDVVEYLKKKGVDL